MHVTVNIKKVILISSFLLFFGANPATAREQLTLKFTTTPAGGKYAPRYVLAVWVEKEDGAFVKTLSRWGRKRAKHLAEWQSADGSDIDGITGATPRSHKEYKISWDFRGRDKKKVSDGLYRIRLELTDHNRDKNKFHRATIVLDKNGKGGSAKIEERDGFKNISMEYRVTPDTAPVLKNGRPGDLTKTSATLRGSVVDTGGNDPRVTLFWGEADGGTDRKKWAHRKDLGILGREDVSFKVSDLVQNKKYHYRLYAENTAGSAWAPGTITFTPCAPTILVKKHETWKYFKGKTDPGKGWHGIAFDDAGWLAGETGIGYSDGDDKTVLEDMRRNYMTVYLRKSIDLRKAGGIQALKLMIDYDDGFVAYLNGIEVARRNVPPKQRFDTKASRDHEAGKPETVDLSDFAGKLKPGKNVFAIEVHNASISSSDLSIIPEITIWSADDP